MEPLSQIDVSSPDHVSVITRDNKVTISITKDGQSVTLGLQLAKGVFNTTPPTPLEQPTPGIKAVKKVITEVNPEETKSKLGRLKATSVHYINGNAKLTAQQVREIKRMLNDAAFCFKYHNRNEAHKAIARMYGVGPCSISNIDRGISWRNVTV